MKHDITRKLAGKYKHTDRPIKDKNGKILTSDEDQLQSCRDGGNILNNS